MANRQRINNETVAMKHIYPPESDATLEADASRSEVMEREEPELPSATIETGAAEPLVC